MPCAVRESCQAIVVVPNSCPHARNCASFRECDGQNPNNFGGRVFAPHHGRSKALMPACLFSKLVLHIQPTFLRCLMAGAYHGFLDVLRSAEPFGQRISDAFGGLGART